jgi:hypothetical protein
VERGWRDQQRSPPMMVSLVLWLGWLLAFR